MQDYLHIYLPTHYLGTYLERRYCLESENDCHWKRKTMENPRRTQPDKLLGRDRAKFNEEKFRGGEILGNL